MITSVTTRVPARTAPFELRRPILIGVSYMIPFVVVGGLLQALGVLLGGRGLTENSAIALSGALLQGGGWVYHTAAVLYTLGVLAFYLMAPVLSGYIAYAIGGRPGIMPGLSAGLAAGVIGAGYLGALIGGVLAGIAAERLARVRLPEALRDLGNFLLVPLAASLLSGGAMLAVIGPPVAAAGGALQSWLTGLGGLSAVLLGAILGAMIAADLGGPVNKAAYTFAVAGVTGTGTQTGSAGVRELSVMAAVMAAGMAAPLACWLATRLRPSWFTLDERRQGAAAGVLGALFISEGAIPFAAVRPLRVIPVLVLGGAITGAGSMAAGATLAVPHGGVLALFAVRHLPGFVAALAVGVGVGAAGLLVARRGRAGQEDETRELADPARIDGAPEAAGPPRVAAGGVAEPAGVAASPESADVARTAAVAEPAA